MTGSVFAQNETVKRLEAQEFVLVDADGRVLGRFGKGNESGSLVLLDRDGVVIWSQPQPLAHPASE